MCRSRHLAAGLVMGCCTLLVAMTGSAATAEAQSCPPGDDCGVDTQPPTITITPASGTHRTNPLSASIKWCDNESLDEASRSITWNGQNVTASFTYVSDVGICMRSSGNVTMQDGQNTLSARICDESQNCTTKNATYTYPETTPPHISTEPHNGDNRALALCVAQCFDVVAGYSTPGYISRDASRSVTLVYSSRRVRPRAVVTLDMRDTSITRPTKVSLSLTRSDGSAVSFTNGSNELFFSPASAFAWQRLAGQFDATGLPTGEHRYTVTVKSYFPSLVEQTAQTVSVLVNTDLTGPLGAGWAVAGTERLSFSTDSNTVVLTASDGSMAVFKATCSTCAYVSPAGDFSRFSRRAAGDSIRYERSFPDGTLSRFTADGRLIEVRDRLGNTVRHGFDASLRLTTVTDPAGLASTLAYDANGKLSTITDPGGRVSRVTIDPVTNDLTRVDDPTTAAAARFTYDAEHRLIETTDRRGGSWKVTYDFAGKLATDSTPAVLAGGSTRRLATRYVSPEARMLIDPATAYGSSANPAPALSRDSVWARVIPSGGDSVRFRVNRFGQATKGEQPALAIVEDFAYNGSAQLGQADQRQRGRLLSSATYTWSGPRLVEVYDGLTRQQVYFAYDTTYSMLTGVYGDLVTTTHYLNAAKTLVDSTRVGDAPAKVSKFTYDATGRLTKVTDPHGDSTRTFYGSTGWQNTDSVKAGTRRSHFRYDSYGRVVVTRNPKNDSSVVSYDLLNRVLSTQGPLGDLTQQAYDSLFVKTLTDAKGQVYQFDRNALGWVEVETLPGTLPLAQRQHRYAYDIAGRVTSWTNRRGQATTMAYNSQGQLTSRTLADGRVTTFAFDTAGHWMTVSNSESTDTIRTDTTGRKAWAITVRAGTRYSLLSSIDSLGRRTRLALEGDSTAVPGIHFYYDSAGLAKNNGRLYGLDSWRGFSSQGRTNFGYDADGLPVAIRLPMGDSIKATHTSAHALSRITFSRFSVNSELGTKYAYDSLTRITQRSSISGDSTRNFTYDKLGRMSGWRHYGHTSQECYPDPTNEFGERCTAGSSVLVAQDTFNYDLVGNRLDLGATIDAGNRLRTFNGYSLDYDADGNLTRKWKTGFDQYFYWNSINQLDSVRTNGAVVRFGYDAFGRRVRKQTDTDLVRYVHDGQQVFFELNSAGAIRRAYTYYPGIDTPHGVEENGSYSYFAQDASGNVVGLLNSAGEIANRYKYAPFGTLESSSEAFANSVRFAGREYDAEAQLYFNRARYYDPALGRFISEDPIGLEGGVNQYAYAGDDPVNSRDPSGLTRCYGNYYGTVTRWNDTGEIISITNIRFVGWCRGPNGELWLDVDDIMGDDLKDALGCPKSMSTKSCRRQYLLRTIRYMRSHENRFCRALGTAVLERYQTGNIKFDTWFQPTSYNHITRTRTPVLAYARHQQTIIYPAGLGAMQRSVVWGAAMLSHEEVHHYSGHSDIDPTGAHWQLFDKAEKACGGGGLEDVVP